MSQAQLIRLTTAVSSAVGMFIEVKVSGFDSMPIYKSSHRDVTENGWLASMADPQRRGFECWAGLYWTILLELG